MPTQNHIDRASLPWVYRASIAQLVVVAAFFGLAVWAITSGLDLLWAMYNGLTVIAMSTGDALVSIAFGVLLLKLMLVQRARHKKVVQQLEMIAEMNHHIRNALENIQLTAHFLHDQQFISDIQTSVERIQWALREVLPKAGEDREDEQRNPK
jgi:signal transduction histidine kinase